MCQLLFCALVSSIKFFCATNLRTTFEHKALKTKRKL